MTEMTDRKFVEWCRTRGDWHLICNETLEEKLILLAGKLDGQDIVALYGMSVPESCDLATLRIDLAEANRKLDRVREEMTSTEHEKGCAAAWYHRGVRESSGKAGKTRMLHRTYVIHEDCNCSRSRVLAILDDSAAPPPVPETRVIIDDPELIPDELCTVTVTMTAADWPLVRMCFSEIECKGDFKVGPRVPALSLIAQRLTEKCPKCEGGEAIYTRAKWIEDCPWCGGTGKQSVPGARFKEAGSHVECR